MTPRDVATETTDMTLTELGWSTSGWRKLLDVPVDELLAVQAELAKKGRGPLTMSGGCKGIGGGGQPGGFSPVVDGTVLPHHPFDAEAPTISKHRPLIVGSNRDEIAFFFFQSKNTAVFELTDVSLKTRLDQESGPNADAVLATYRKSRPSVSPGPLHRYHHSADDLDRVVYDCGAKICSAWIARIHVHVHARLQLHAYRERTTSSVPMHWKSRTNSTILGFLIRNRKLG